MIVCAGNYSFEVIFFSLLDTGYGRLDIVCQNTRMWELDKLPHDEELIISNARINIYEILGHADIRLSRCDFSIWFQCSILLRPLCLDEKSCSNHKEVRQHLIRLRIPFSFNPLQGRGEQGTGWGRWRWWPGSVLSPGVGIGQSFQTKLINQLSNILCYRRAFWHCIDFSVSMY